MDGLTSEPCEINRIKIIGFTKYVYIIYKKSNRNKHIYNS